MSNIKKTETPLENFLSDIFINILDLDNLYSGVISSLPLIRTNFQ